MELLRMPLDETIATFSYFITEADKLGLAFFEIMRYSPLLDVEFDGVSRATQHDVFATYRPFVKNTKLILNGGILPEEGTKLVADGTADAISIGFNFITHSDLVKRIAHGKPLDNAPDFPHLQTNKTSGDWATGYTDYPLAKYD